jgi:argininosuccinate lyase
MTLWGARFQKNSSNIFSQMNRSLDVDHRLVFEDLAASKEWAVALQEVEVLTKKEAQIIVNALDAINDELVNKNDISTITQSTAEDIHTWIEWQLIDKIGDLGKKIHTGRSRNDQVITALKMWMKHAAAQIRLQIKSLIDALCQQGLAYKSVIMPGFTHLQLAQPMSFGHWLHAIAEALSRDLKRVDATLLIHDTCPLGSAALTGNAFGIERSVLAKNLSFDHASLNSLDSVSSRDFVSDFLYCASQSSIQLSKFAEDCIFFASDQVGFIKLSDEVTSGSSIMPQKKNPDSLELIRSIAGQILGGLTGFNTSVKGTPSGYNKDLQSDKLALFTAFDQWMITLKMTKEVVNGLQPKEQKMLQSVNQSFANATEIADYLALKGVPFRDAHNITGKMVNDCEKRNQTLFDLNVPQFKSYHSAFEADVIEWLSPLHAINRRRSLGGTAFNQVKVNIENTLFSTGLLTDNRRSE